MNVDQIKAALDGRTFCIVIHKQGFLTIEGDSYPVPGEETTAYHNVPKETLYKINELLKEVPQ